MPKMKPRLSAPSTVSIRSLRNGLAISSTESARPAGSWSIGVMSRNVIPGSGKSGTSAISDRSCCTGSGESGMPPA